MFSIFFGDLGEDTTEKYMIGSKRFERNSEEIGHKLAESRKWCTDLKLP